MPWCPIPMRLACGTRAGSGRPTAAMVQAGSPTVPAADMRRAASVAAEEVYQVVVGPSAGVGVAVGFGSVVGFVLGFAVGCGVGFAVAAFVSGSAVSAGCRGPGETGG
ncbi:hypothetical protein SUDANB60_06071 [Streptomyces sp. enrichment culture]